MAWDKFSYISLSIPEEVRLMSKNIELSLNKAVLSRGKRINVKETI